MNCSSHQIYWIWADFAFFPSEKKPNLQDSTLDSYDSELTQSFFLGFLCSWYGDKKRQEISLDLVKHRAGALLKTRAHNYTDWYKLKLWGLLAGAVPGQMSIVLWFVQSLAPVRADRTRRAPSGTGLLVCAWAQVGASKLRIVTPLPVHVSVSVPAQGRHRPPALSHEMAAPWDQQVLEMPLLQHHSGTGSAGMRRWAYTMGHLGIADLPKQRNLVTAIIYWVIIRYF